MNPARLEKLPHNIGIERIGRDRVRETTHTLNVPGRANQDTTTIGGSRRNLNSTHPPTDVAGSVSPLHAQTALGHSRGGPDHWRDPVREPDDRVTGPYRERANPAMLRWARAKTGAAAPVSN